MVYAAVLFMRHANFTRTDIAQRTQGLPHAAAYTIAC
jgi:hypothetical protein